MLGIELITTTHGKVYNRITDHETYVDNLNPNHIVCLRYWGLFVGRVAERVLPGVSRASL